MPEHTIRRVPVSTSASTMRAFNFAPVPDSANTDSYDIDTCASSDDDDDDDDGNDNDDTSATHFTSPADHEECQDESAEDVHSVASSQWRHDDDLEWAHRDEEAADDSSTASDAAESESELDFGAGEDHVIEVVDGKYHSAGHKVISSDGVIFYINAATTRQSGIWYHIFRQCMPASGLQLADPVLESADSLRLLFDVVGDKRLDGLPPSEWPSIKLVSATLRLAQKYRFDAAYKIVVAHLEARLVIGDLGTLPLDAFRLAAALDDHVLAKLAVKAMECQADCSLPLANWHTRDVHNGTTLPAMLYYPGTWSPSMYAAVPPAYTWALMRAIMYRAVPWGAGDDKCHSTRACADLFGEFLALYRAEVPGTL